MWSIGILIAGVFSPIAAVIAFVITYEEWSHHLLPKRQILMKALHMAAVTFVFFLVLGLVAAAALTATLAPE